MAEDGLVDVDGLLAYLENTLSESLLVEAVYCHGAYGQVCFPDGLVELNERFSAWRPAREARDASLALGRRFVRLVSSLEPSEPLKDAAASGELHFCVAFGFSCAVLGFPLVDSVAAFLHQNIASAVSAAQRLLPLGQLQASRITWNLKEHIERTARRALALDIRSVGAFSTLTRTGFDAPSISLDPLVHQLMPAATLSLEFHTQRDGTSLRVIRQDPPWRALRAFANASGEALVHLHNVSGGVVGGDQLRLEIDLAPSTRAQITTVGATRVHRHRVGWPDADQATVLHVGSGALLEYLPDPVIPFARSRFSQTSEIHLAAGGGLIAWDTLSAGRIARGESFHFDNFSAKTAIYSRGTPIALERYSLVPSLQNMTSPARMGPFLYSATMYVCRADSSSDWLKLENDLNEIARELSGPEALWGASALVRCGVVIRGMTFHAHQVKEGLHRLWRAAKQSVWARDALLPRKIT